jgi:hypothetical protein
MIYRGYRILRTSHPTRVVPGYMGYDIKNAGQTLKANFATIDGAKLYIDLMIRLHRWPDLRKEK